MVGQLRTATHAPYYTCEARNPTVRARAAPAIKVVSSSGGSVAVGPPLPQHTMKIALICLGRCKDKNGVKSIYSKIFSVESVNIIERINSRNPLNQKNQKPRKRSQAAKSDQTVARKGLDEGLPGRVTPQVDLTWLCPNFLLRLLTATPGRPEAARRGCISAIKFKLQRVQPKR